MINPKSVTLSETSVDGAHVTIGGKCGLGVNLYWPQNYTPFHMMTEFFRMSSIQLNGECSEIPGHPTFFKPDNDSSSVRYYPIRSTRYKRNGTRYAVTWEGEGTIAFSTHFTDRVAVSPNRAEGDLTSEIGTVWITVTSGAPYNIKMFALEDEEDFIAGQFLTKEYIERFKGVSCIRFMNWSQASSNHEELVSQITPPGPRRWTRNIAPIEDCCKVVKNLGWADPWFSLPYRLSDAAVIEYGRQIRANISPGACKIWIELGNEIWNWGNPWGTGTRFVGHAHHPHWWSDVDQVTNEMLHPNHGFENGTRLSLLTNVDRASDSPVSGGTGYVVNAATNRFQLLDAQDTIRELRDGLPIVYRVFQPDSDLDIHRNYGKRSLRYWRLLKPILGDDMVCVMGSWWASEAATAQRLEDPEVYAWTDYVAVANYIGPGSYVGGGSDVTLPDFLTAYDDKTMTDAIAESFLQRMSERWHMHAKHGKPVVSYECGEHVSNSGVTTEEIATVERWNNHAGMKEFYDYYFRLQAAFGSDLACHYRDVDSHQNNSCFGLLADTYSTHPKYEGVRPFLKDLNGIPRRSYKWEP